MLRSIVLIIFATLLAQMPRAQVNATLLLQQADSAYIHDNFNEALNLYNQVSESTGTSAKLYYNIANCYYRLGAMGKAIVNYERALRLDPNDRDIRDNLQFVNSRITDEPGDRGMFITKTVNALANRMSGNAWATIALVSFVLLLICIALYFICDNIMLRKIGFFGSFILLILCIIANILASISTRHATSDDEAVIIVPATMLSTSPRTPKDRSEEALLLHEGTKIQILDSVTTRTSADTLRWYDVRVDNDHRAWVKGTDIERI